MAAIVPGLFNGLIGNANWRGVSLREVLEEAGIQDGAKEVVFFGDDKAMEEIRGQEVEKAFARSMSIPDAMRQDNLLAYEMNGEPLPIFHGKPLRLLVPGWYGVSNVKWLTQIHVQNTRYMGRFMGRDYVTLKRVMVGGEERWVENSVTGIQLKSAIVRVTELGGNYSVLGFVLNDGTPLQSVEVSVDGGPWQTAQLSEENTQYSWEAVYLQLGKCRSGRTYPGIARNRCKWQRAADRGRGSRKGQPLGELCAVSPQLDYLTLDQVSLRPPALAGAG